MGPKTDKLGGGAYNATESLHTPASTFMPLAWQCLKAPKGLPLTTVTRDALAKLPLYKL